MISHLTHIFQNPIEEIAAAVADLPVEESSILLAKYPLDDTRPLTFLQTAEKFNLKPNSIQGKIRTILGHLSGLTPRENVKVTATKRVSRATLDFEERREQIGLLISMLSDPTQQVVLLLRLGYVNRKCYKEEEIANFLLMAQEEIAKITNRGLKNMLAISGIAKIDVSAAKEQLQSEAGITL